MRNPFARWISSSTIFVFVTFELTFGSLAFAILALVSGHSASTLQEAAILTCDTSSVPAAVQVFVNSSVPITTVPDWFEVHYLTVCHGLWANGSYANGKNLASVVCESRPAGYTFSLAAEIAAHVPVAAAPLFADWPLTFGTLPTRTALALLSASIGIGIISLFCYLYGLATTPKFLPGTNLNVLRGGYLAGIATAILATNSASQIAAKAYKQRGMSPADVPVLLNVWTEPGFYVFIWCGTGLIWLAVIVSTTFSVILHKKLARVADRPNEGQELVLDDLNGTGHR